MEPKEVKLRVNLRASIRHDKDAQIYVSYCPELNLYSQGISVDSSKKALSSAIGLYLKTAIETQTLDRVLKEHNLTAIRQQDGTIDIVRAEEAKNMEVSDPGHPRPPGDKIDVEQALKMAFSPPTSWREMPETMSCPAGHDAYRRVVKEGQLEIPCYVCIHCIVIYRYTECGPSNTEDYVR